MSILSGGEKYDLEAYGDSIAVSISNAADTVSVTHVKIDVTDGEGGLDEGALALAQSQKLESEDLAVGTTEDTVFFDLTSCSLLLGLGNTKAGDTKAADWPDPLFERADQCYGPNGTSESLVVELTGPDGSPVKAGETLIYNITYKTTISANYTGHEYDSTSTLFDEYRNVKLTVRLPEGLKLQAVGKNGSFHSGGFHPDPNDPQLYIIEIDSTVSATETLPSDIDLQVYVLGNGTANAIRTYNAADMKDMVTFSADWTILDKSVHPAVETTKKYSKTVTASGNPFQVVSPDEWGLDKVAENPVLNTSARTVTYTWEIGVGLKDAEGNIMTSLNDGYDRPGRDLVESLTLDEALSALLSRVSGSNQENVTPTSFTIQRSGSGKDPTPVTGNIVIWGQGSTDDLRMESAAVIDSDGDSQKETVTPYFTRYIVKAVYPYTADKVVEFYDNDPYQIKSTNTATMTEQLAKKSPRNETKTVDKVQVLNKDVPASFTISKKLYKYGQANPVNYENQHGPVTYALANTAGTAFELYELVNGAYSKVTNVNQLSAGKTYYLKAGGQYQVTEQFSSTEMFQDDVTPADGKFTAVVANTPTSIQFFEASSASREMMVLDPP